MVLAQGVYDVPANVILDSAARAVATWDVVTSMIKAWVFGTIIAIVSCGLALLVSLHKSRAPAGCLTQARSLAWWAPM